MELIPYLRLVHIVCGTFWVGANLFMAFFLHPALKISGDSSKEFMKNLINQHNLPLWMNASSMLTVVSGLWLLWLISGGFAAGFFGSFYGVWLSLGSGLAILAFLHGFFMIRPCGMRMAEIGKGLATGQFTRNETLAREIDGLQSAVASRTRHEAWLMMGALALMVLAKYL